MPEINSNERHTKKTNRESTFFHRYGTLLISHHPECEEFKNHTLKLGSLHLCIGCFIGYPTAIMGIIIFDLFKIYLYFNSFILLLFGIIFISFFILSPLNLTKQKGIKILQKFFIGFGSVFLFWWIWTLTSDFYINLLTFIVIFGVIMVIINGYHAYSFLKVCQTCKYATNWHNCPGFHRVYNKN